MFYFFWTGAINLHGFLFTRGAVEWTLLNGQYCHDAPQLSVTYCLISPMSISISFGFMLPHADFLILGSKLSFASNAITDTNLTKHQRDRLYLDILV